MPHLGDQHWSTSIQVWLGINCYHSHFSFVSQFPKLNDYLRPFFNDVHDDSINTEDNEYCYEDVVDTLYMGNLQ